MAGFDFSGTSEERLKEDVNAWIARFAPLVMDAETLEADEVRYRLGVVEGLRLESSRLQGRVRDNIVPLAPDVTQTFEKAIGQLDSIEGDLRRALAKLAPGDPAGLVDLDQLQDRLAEREARDELGIESDAIPEVLEMQTNPGNLGSGAAIGLFGLVFGGFATGHAILMIGGLWSAFGWPAIFMLLFYSIFWAAAAAMINGAFNAAAKETISLDGRKLTVTRKLGGIVRKKTYTLARDCQMEVGETQIVRMNSNNRRSPPVPAIIAADEEGREIAIGANAPEPLLKKNCAKINAYLKAKG